MSSGDFFISFISKSVRRETDEKIKKLKNEIQGQGEDLSESDIIEEGVEMFAEDLGVEFEEEEKDDFMDVFK